MFAKAGQSVGFAAAFTSKGAPVGCDATYNVIDALTGSSLGGGTASSNGTGCFYATVEVASDSCPFAFFTATSQDPIANPLDIGIQVCGGIALDNLDAPVSDIESLIDERVDRKVSDLEYGINLILLKLGLKKLTSPIPEVVKKSGSPTAIKGQVTSRDGSPSIGSANDSVLPADAVLDVEMTVTGKLGAVPKKLTMTYIYEYGAAFTDGNGIPATMNGGDLHVKVYNYRHRDYDTLSNIQTANPYPTNPNSSSSKEFAINESHINEQGVIRVKMVNDLITAPANSTDVTARSRLDVIDISATMEDTFGAETTPAAASNTATVNEILEILNSPDLIVQPTILSEHDMELLMRDAAWIRAFLEADTVVDTHRKKIFYKNKLTGEILMIKEYVDKGPVQGAKFKEKNTQEDAPDLPTLPTVPTIP
jgi:hypothetical protein